MNYVLTGAAGKITRPLAKKLLAEKVISTAEFEQAQNSFLTAQANLNAAKQNIRSGEAGITGFNHHLFNRAIFL